MDRRIAFVLTDIEGTTTPIDFVHRVLFPYARARIPALIAQRGGEPDIASVLDRVRALAPGRDPGAALEAWQDEDAKIEPLKTLQGLVWREGYESGALEGRIYADAAMCLRRWHQGGIGLAVYSSGSADAQRLIFGRSDAGDLASLFSAFFDTNIGAKRAPASYEAIARRLGVTGSTILFLSDIGAELDAAAAAGFATCQIVRAEDRTIAAPGHEQVPDFEAAGRAFGLPGARGEPG